MGPMHGKSLKWLSPTVLEMHLHYLIYGLGVKVTQKVAQYRIHHVAYARAKFGAAVSNSLGDVYLQENTLIDLDLRSYKVAQCPLHHGTYAPAKFEAVSPTVLEMHLHYLIYDLGVKVTQKVDQYRLHHVAYARAKFGVAVSNGLGDVYLQENTLFDLDLRSYKVAQCPLHHGTYAPTKFGVVSPTVLEMHLHYLIFDLGIKVTQKVAQYLIHHVAIMHLQSLELLCQTV